MSEESEDRMIPVSEGVLAGADADVAASVVRAIIQEAARQAARAPADRINLVSVTVGRAVVAVKVRAQGSPQQRVEVFRRARLVYTEVVREAIANPK